MSNNETQLQAAALYVAKNEILMDFVITEAHEQVAKDIRSKTGSGTTAKAVQLLLFNGKDESIQKRFMKYVAAGIAEVAKVRVEALAA
tara:strand:+ start:148 stop:411 length:264 start_codon:yes stop_codon:yes gene_type:complete